MGLFVEEKRDSYVLAFLPWADWSALWENENVSGHNRWKEENHEKD